MGGDRIILVKIFKQYPKQQNNKCVRHFPVNMRTVLWTHKICVSEDCQVLINDLKFFWGQKENGRGKRVTIFLSEDLLLINGIYKKLIAPAPAP